MERKQVFFGIAALVGLVAAAVPALAGPVDDTVLASPNGITTSPSNPSFYSGTGNPQGQFEVNTDNTSGIELGLNAIFAFVGPVVPPPIGNVYTVPTGVGSNGRAVWDYDFSIDLNPGGNSTALTFATPGLAATALLTVTDTTKGTSGSYNPLLNLPDDDSYGSVAGTTLAGKHHPEIGTDWSAQNSESLSFGFPPLGFDPWNGDSYTITLSIGGGASGVAASSDTIVVNAVPEPASMALLGAGLLGLGVIRRRRRA